MVVHDDFSRARMLERNLLERLAARIGRCSTLQGSE